MRQLNNKIIYAAYRSANVVHRGNGKAEKRKSWGMEPK